MINSILEIIIWSFAIYGFLMFVKEYGLDCFCYVTAKLIDFLVYLKNSLIKFMDKYIIKRQI